MTSIERKWKYLIDTYKEVHIEECEGTYSLRVDLAVSGREYVDQGIHVDFHAYYGKTIGEAVNQAYKLTRDDFKAGYLKEKS